MKCIGKEQIDFENLFRQYYPILCEIGRGYIYNVAVVEEIVSDVFLRYWNNKEKINIRSSLRDYLLMSLKNGCIDYIRAERKRKHNTLYIDEHVVVCSTLADLGENPFDYLVSAETQKQITDAIDELPDRYRQTFTLCRLDEKSYDEAAKIMGITKNTVKSNLREATALLMKKLKKK